MTKPTQLATLQRKLALPLVASQRHGVEDHMEGLIEVAGPATGIAVAVRHCRDAWIRWGRAAVTGLAIVIAMVGSTPTVLAQSAVDRVLIHISDDYAWSKFQQIINRIGLDLTVLFEVAPGFEHELKQLAVALLRRHADTPDQAEAAGLALGEELHRKYFGKRIPYGNEASIIEWGRAQLNLLETAALHSKQICGDVAFGKVASFLLLGPSAVAAANRLAAAVASAARTSDPATSIPSEEVLQPIWEAILAGPGRPFSEDDLNALAVIETIPRPRACDVMIALAGRILDLPQADAVAVLRWMLFISNEE